MKEKGSSVFCVDRHNSSVPALFPGVTLPFFLSIAFLCFRLKLQPTKKLLCKIPGESLIYVFGVVEF